MKKTKSLLSTNIKKDSYEFSRNRCYVSVDSLFLHQSISLSSLNMVALENYQLLTELKQQV